MKTLLAALDVGYVVTVSNDNEDEGGSFMAEIVSYDDNDQPHRFRFVADDPERALLLAALEAAR